MPKKKMRMLSPSSQICPVIEGTDFCYRSSQFVLSDLPNELIRKLHKYLDMPSLVAISQLNIQRLNSQFDTLLSVDFSTYNTIGIEDLQSYFNKERVKHVKELNFNNLFLVTPHILTTCIVKCKNISKLYILNCGITFSQIIKILDSCTHLEELYWSIQGEDYLSVIQQKTKLTESIKKLYLQVGFGPAMYVVAEKFIDMCPNTEEFVVNLSPHHVTSLPSYSATKYFTVPLRLKTQARSLVILLQSNADKVPVEMCRFVDKMTALKDPKVFDFFKLGDANDVPFHSTCYTSLLQFFDENKQLDELPTLPNESVKSLVMILRNNIEILNHLDKIKKMTGNALKHLSIHKLLPRDFFDAESAFPYVQNLLGSIVANSCNITVLDLSQLHVTGVLLFSSLCNLRKLKVFNVSTCCFILNNKVGAKQYTIQDCQNDFQNFIEKCNRVEKFSIYDCKSICKSPPMNDMLCLVSKWGELRYLTVQNVKELRDCQFLIPISNSCPRLKSLEFISVGETQVCHFMSNIKHVLIKSKELTFLRINQPGFYPMDPLLWNCLESAQQLQGLCLTSLLTTAVVNKTVLDAINKLPYLHLFHLLTRNNCENLSQQIKRVMTSKGVKIPDVKIYINAYYDSLEECCSRHFPTR